MDDMYDDDDDGERNAAPALERLPAVQQLYPAARRLLLQPLRFASSYN